ncbi:Apolipophorin [Frankliniella fusca]|uniref:Apolipophorin n=1 Tax=Frankliniella fusca TaxID=407009 RepID=A0AAE1LHU5_9NEOP|nr:Apolipophorin [Frankliniella fusca]
MGRKGNKAHVSQHTKMLKENTAGIICPLMETEVVNDCCQGECSFHKHHDCKWVKYQTETCEKKKHHMWMQVREENIILEERLRQLKVELGLL